MSLVEYHLRSQNLRTIYKHVKPSWELTRIAGVASPRVQHRIDYELLRHTYQTRLLNNKIAPSATRICKNTISALNIYTAK